MSARGEQGRPAWRRTLLLALALFACAGCIFGLGLVLRFKGLQTAANLAQLASVLLALLTPVQLLLTWWRDTRKPPVATPEDLVGAKEQLAMLLMAQWRTESQLRALDDPDPIPVRWRLTDREELVDVPSNRTAGVLTVASSADVAALIREFRRLRRRRLVILGDAGAGKTTLAVQIILELLRTRTKESAEPVPVLLSLAGWKTSSRTRLHEWVADRIFHDYPELSAAGFGRHVVQALAAQGHVLPILDGLDEAAPDVQETVIEALNRSMDGDAQLILTSRIGEFSDAVEAAKRALTSAVVIEPEPLTAAAAADYLQSCLPPVPGQAWPDVLHRLRTGTEARGASAALAEIVTFPLGLWLIRAAYISPGVDPAPLLDDERFATTTAMRAHLFDELIWACIQARPPSDNPTDLFRPRHSYDPEDVERWMRFLAANLDRWDTRDLDWTRNVGALAAPVRWPAPAARLLHRWVPVAEQRIEQLLGYRRWMWLPLLVAVLGVLCGIGAIAGAIGEAATFLADPQTSDTIGSLFGFLVVVAVVVAFGRLIVIMSRQAEPDDVDWEKDLSGDWYAARTYLVTVAQPVSFGLVYALLTGVLSGVLTELAIGEGAGWRVGLVVGSVVGVLASIGFHADREMAPGAGWRPPWYGIGPWPGVRSGLAQGVWLGGAGGVVMGAIYANGDDHTGRIMTGFIAVLVAVLGALFGLFRGVVVPIFFSLASLVVACVRIAQVRSTRAPQDDGRDDSLALWCNEGLAQRLRLLRIALLTAFVSVAASGLWLAARSTPEWISLQAAGLEGWLASHLTDFDVTWTGQLRYAFAVVIAWAVTIPSTGHRGWRRWIVWLVVFGLVVLLWPRSARPDPFLIHLSGRFEDLDATLTLDAQAQLAGRVTKGEAVQTYDIAAILASQDMRLVALAVLGLVGLIVIGTCFVGVENGQPRVWWSNQVAGLWHVARGRMPRDLMAFLDDAHRLGLLRAVGTVYQFRHAEFQDHLARPPGSVDRTSVIRPRTPSSSHPAHQRHPPSEAGS